MITLNSINLLRNGTTLLEDTSVIIHLGQHVGLVGGNGAGKSSLLAMLTNDLQPDKGDVAIDSGRGISHMSQEIIALDREAVEYVLDGDERLRSIENDMLLAEKNQAHEKVAELHDQYLSADGYTARSRAEKLLVGIGFHHNDTSKSVRDFSGGWRMRLNLARALMSPADILLLDEPTNHLDLDAILWLENYLQRFQGTLIVISHDRDFLDAVTDTTLHIEHKSLHKYRGGYSAFEKIRAERLAQQQSLYEKQKQQKEHMEHFVERFRAKATKARQAQSRLKALSKLEDIAPAYEGSLFTFAFPDADKISSPLLTLDQACLGYDNNILIETRMNIQPGTRIGLLGTNGAGKSTLIKSLSGDIPLVSGHRYAGEHLRIGYFAQHQIESLDANASPLLHLKRLSPDAREQKLRNFIGSFGFMGDKATEVVNGFSGGEKARLALAIIAWKKPNLLLLDEPTNHLDLEMRHALTVALQCFSGAMIVISHDRNLIRNTVNELLLVHDGKLSVFNGDIDDYGHWLLRKNVLESSSDDGEEKKAQENSSQAKKDQKRLEAEKRKTLRPLKLKVDKMEKNIDGIQKKLVEVNEILSNPSIYEEVNKQELRDFLAKQAQLKKDLSEAEDSWLLMQEEWEDRINS